MKREFSDPSTVSGHCLCGVVTSRSIIRRSGPGMTTAAPAGSRTARPMRPMSAIWRKRFRVTAGEDEIARYEDKATGSARSFCRRCGTPLIYERARRAT